MAQEDFMNIDSSDEEEEKEEIKIIKVKDSKRFAAVEKVQITILNKNGAKRVQEEEIPVV